MRKISEQRPFAVMLQLLFPSRSNGVIIIPIPTARYGEKCKVMCAKILVNFIELTDPYYRDRRLLM